MISVDTAEVNKNFAAEHEVPFPILSDISKEVGTAYGVMIPAGMTKRWTFYIDKEGIIQKIDTKVRAPKAGEDTLTILGELGILGN